MPSSVPAKFLLFGEHTILHGSPALGCPLFSYQASLQINSPQPAHIWFTSWLEYLRQVRPEENLPDFDIRAFEAEAEALSIQSNIPMGSGLGSSGALTALLYGRFGKAPASDDSARLRILQDQLALMEGFFHGRSSGIDPLICYLGRPLMVDAKGKVEQLPALQAPPDDKKMRLGLPVFHESGYWELVDSGQRREGKRAIETFKDLLAASPSGPAVLEDLIALNTRLVDGFAGAFRQNQTQVDVRLFADLNKLSGLQFAHLSPLIAESLQEDWYQGLMDGNRIYKLCGAGGGGYYLVYKIES